MLIQKLEPTKRTREYYSYNDEQRAKVGIQYLFHSMSHCNLDKIVLGLDSNDCNGFQSMGILPHPLLHPKQRLSIHLFGAGAGGAAQNSREIHGKAGE